MPPRFHVSLILCELGNYVDAEILLDRAVDAGIQSKGRFLAYRADALSLHGSDDLARELYREAFLRNPLNVDLPHLADRSIHGLVTDVAAAVDETSGNLPRLPVRGWLSSIFPLDLNDLATGRPGVLSSLAEAEAAGSLTVPQVWYEYLRTTYRDDQEIIRARRRLKDLNDGMFRRYMKKIGCG
jgi:tetratricopeptide (TPR) repeat protein